MGINKIKDRQKLQNGWNNADLANELIDLFNSSKIELYGRDLSNIDFLLLYKDSFSQIKILDLAGNNLKEIPSWIALFTNLETLNLEGNQMETLPIEIWKLIKLKLLKLAGTNIDILPVEISGLNLEKLTIDKLNVANENLRNKVPNIEEAMNASNFNFDDDEERG